MENPTLKPSSVLTQKSDNLIETQVMEVYDGLSLKQEQTLGVELEGNLPTSISFKEHGKCDDGKNIGLQLKIVDLGKSQTLCIKILCSRWSPGVFRRQH